MILIIYNNIAIAEIYVNVMDINKGGLEKMFKPTGKVVSRSTLYAARTPNGGFTMLFTEPSAAARYAAMRGYTMLKIISTEYETFTHTVEAHENPYPWLMPDEAEAIKAYRRFCNQQKEVKV